MRFRILIILFVFIELLSVMIYARNPSFTSLENSINAKMNNFKTNCTGKLTSFENNVNGKLNAWDSNYQSKMKSFESGVNAKCNALSTSIANKVSALESSINNKFDSAGFSAFKSDANNAFKNLASELATMKNDLKSSLQAELGDSFNSISADFDSFSSGLQGEATDIANDFESGGELSDAVDECEDNYRIENALPQNTISNWVPYNDFFILYYPAGTWTFRGTGRMVNAYRGTLGSSIEIFSRYGPGSTFTASASGFMTGFGHEGCHGLYLVEGDSEQPDPGFPSDSDNDGYSDAQENASGSNPNDASSVPVPEEPEPESAVDLKGASSGNSAIDAIIAKLIPDFTVFYGASPQDFTLTIPVHLGDLYSTEWHIGPFDDLLDGKIAWLRAAIRGFVMAVMSFVFIRSLVKVLKEW